MRKYSSKLFHVEVAALACMLIAAPMDLSAQSLQRLFSTPAARAELDRLRIQIATGAVVEQTEVEPVVELPLITDDEEVDVIYALGGTLRKADGNYTVWINNIAYDQANLPPNIELIAPFDRGQVMIRDTDSGARFNVKPGQVLNLSTGQLYESYQYQAIVAAAAEEAARVAAEEAMLSGQSTGSVILDSAAVESVLDAAQDL